MSLFVTRSNPLDKTIQIFDEFYATNLLINAIDYDVVLAFFKESTNTIDIAENFTAVFFRIAQESDVDALALLENIKGINTVQLNKVMAYYLNSFKSKTSLYGVGKIPTPVQPVARNVVL